MSRIVILSLCFVLLFGFYILDGDHIFCDGCDGVYHNVFGAAYGQRPQANTQGAAVDDTSNPEPNNIDDTAVLWAPKQMIAGQAYQGVIITKQAALPPVGHTAFLSTDDNNIASAPQSVVIPAYHNHGIFMITPHAPGTTHLFATIQDTLYKIPLRVFSPQSVPASLQIVTPANITKTDSMLVYITILDRNGLPVLAPRDISVSLTTSSSAIELPHNTIIIRNGTSYTKFEIDVRGTGSITATADGLKLHTTHIQKVQDEFTVHVAVAPYIAMKHSAAFYYVWLEKDGKPFRPPHTIDAFLHSNDHDVARFEVGVTPRHENTDGILIHLVEGMAKGILYTGTTGYAVITATVPDFGTSQSTMFVGSARFNNFDNDSKNSENIGNSASPKVKLQEQNLLEIPNRLGMSTTTATTISDNNSNNKGGKRDQYLEPNLLMSWIYPETTDKKAWGVIATYNINKTKYLDTIIDDITGQTQHIIAQNAVITPVYTHGNKIYVSSDTSGLDHKSSYIIKDHISTKTNSMEFDITGINHGLYEVTVSGQGFRSAQSHLTIAPPYTEGFEFGVTVIPTIPGTLQDIAMISIFDQTGAMINPLDIFGLDVSFLISHDTGTGTRVITTGVEATTTTPHNAGSAVNTVNTTDIHTTTAEIPNKQIRPVYSGSAILHGTIFGHTRITAILDGVQHATQDITSGGIPTSIEILAPRTVHTTEPFPFVIHHIDNQGTPVRKAVSSITLQTPSDITTTHRDITTDHSLPTLTLQSSSPKKISAVSPTGIAEHTITGFENTMSVFLELQKNVLRVGENTTFNILNSIDDAVHTIHTDIPFVQTAKNTFVLVPNQEFSESMLSVTATKPGYTPVTVTETLSVKQLYSLNVFTIESTNRDDGNYDGIYHGDIHARIFPSFDITLGGNLIDGIRAPYHTEFRPSPLQITFPVYYTDTQSQIPSESSAPSSSSSSQNSGGYILEYILFNDQKISKENSLSLSLDNFTDNMDITAVYSRQVLVDVIQGTGSGVYKFGDVVTIHAPSQNILSFLIRNVFDHWVYPVNSDIHLSSNPQESFIATKDVVITAVYKKDYTYLMVCIMIPVLGGSILTLIKSVTSIRWSIQNTLERILKMLSLKKVG